MKIILNPCRFKITAYLNNRKSTVKGLLTDLPEIPQASMYRHVKILEENDIIKRTSEKKIKGIIEPVYTLNISLEGLPVPQSGEDLNTAALAVFFTYVSGPLWSMNHEENSREIIEQTRFNNIKLNLEGSKSSEFYTDMNELLSKYRTGEHENSTHSLTTFLLPHSIKEQI